MISTRNNLTDGLTSLKIDFIPTVFDLFMYNLNIIIHKCEVVTPIPDSRTPVDFFDNKKYVRHFTNDDMISKFEVYTDKKIDISLNLAFMPPYHSQYRLVLFHTSSRG